MWQPLQLIALSVLMTACLSFLFHIQLHVRSLSSYSVVSNCVLCGSVAMDLLSEFECWSVVCSRGGYQDWL